MAYGAKRAPIPKRKSPLQQFGEDVVQGTGKIIEQGKIAVEKVKAGTQKTLRFLRGKP